MRTLIIALLFLAGCRTPATTTPHDIFPEDTTEEFGTQDEAELLIEMLNVHQEDAQKILNQLNEWQDRVQEAELVLVGLERKVAQLNRLLHRSERPAEASFSAIDQMEKKRQLLWTACKLENEDSVGSGILIHKRPLNIGYEYFVLTAWHVPRDLIPCEDLTEPIPITLYPGGAKKETTCRLVLHDPGMDIALVRLVDEQEMDVAWIASLEEVHDVDVFDEIDVVGCHIGNDPTPTGGDISTLSMMIDDRQYWMTTAPVYIGTSGGGVYRRDSHELIAIMSKIFTVGIRDTIVPHMGCVTPLGTEVRTWLEEGGYGFVLE